MTKFDCTTKVCNLSQDVFEMVRGGPSDFINGVPSLRASVQRSSNTLAKGWNKLISYSIGDLVSRNGVAYIAQLDNNINRDPLSDRLAWKYLVNPYESNKGKVKAFCYHVGSTIVDSYNIASLTTRVGSFKGNYLQFFEFTFLQEFTEPPVLLTSIPLITDPIYPVAQDMGPTAHGVYNTTTKATIGYTSKTYQYRNTYAPSAQRQLYNFVEPDKIEGFVAWYSNDEIIPPVV